MAASFSMSLQVGVTAVFRISAASSNSNATASQRPKVSRTSFFAAGGVLLREKITAAFRVASMAAIAMMTAAANSTPRAMIWMSNFASASSQGATLHWSGGEMTTFHHTNCTGLRPQIPGVYLLPDPGNVNDLGELT